MDAFTKDQKKIRLVIDDYIADKVPQEIKSEIHNKLIDYYWSNTKLSDFTYKEFRDIVILCTNEINNESANKPFIDAQKLLYLLKDKKVNSNRFCLMSRRDWCLLLRKNKICSIGQAMKLRTKIQSFDFAAIEIGMPIYLPLNKVTQVISAKN